MSGLSSGARESGSAPIRLIAIDIDGTPFQATGCSNFEKYASQLCAPDLPNYCYQPFCFVDPTNCDTGATPSSYYPGGTADSGAAVPGLSYSYATCGAR